MTILSYVKVNSMVSGYKGETKTSLMIRNDIEETINRVFTIFIKIL